MRTLRNPPGLFGLAAAALLTLAPAAHAQEEVQSYLNAVNRLYQNLENERALEQVQRAKKFSRGVEDDALIALYEGIILADLGRKEEAQASFKTGLFLRPDARLPLKVSPKVERDFEALRAKVKEELRPLQRQQEAERLRKEQERLAAERLAAQKAEAEQKAAAARAPVTRVPAEALAGGQPPAVRAGGPTVWTWLLSGAAVAAGGGGAYFGLSAQQSNTQALNSTFQDERARYLEQRQGQAMTANVLFATAGAAAVGAVASLLLNGGEAPASH